MWPFTREGETPSKQCHKAELPEGFIRPIPWRFRVERTDVPISDQREHVPWPDLWMLEQRLRNHRSESFLQTLHSTPKRDPARRFAGSRSVASCLSWSRVPCQYVGLNCGLTYANHVSGHPRYTQRRVVPAPSHLRAAPSSKTPKSACPRSFHTGEITKGCSAR